MSADNLNTVSEPESMYLDLLGKNPEAMLKIIDTLLDHPTYPYNKKELGEVNDISPSTVYKYWDKLEKYDIVEVDKVQGGTKLYTLNDDNMIVKRLYQLHEAIQETYRENEEKTDNED